MKPWLAALLLISGTAQANGVEVRREQLPGPDRIDASLTVPVDMPVVLAALETPCAVKHWLPRTDEIRVLERDAGGHRTVLRMRTDFPWPWRDRIARLQFQRTRENGRVIIEMEALPMPDEDRAVVVPQSWARWELAPENSGVRIDYQQRFTPGGTVPQWLADQVAKGQVRNALDNLRTLVENHNGGDCRWHPDADGGSSQPP